MSPVDPHFLSSEDCDRWEHDHPCPKCDYNLRGLLINSNCPECGTVVPAPDKSEALGGQRRMLVDRIDEHVEGKKPTSPRIVGSAVQSCLSCGYNLEGLGAAGRCPECGLIFEEQRARAAAAAQLMPQAIAGSNAWRLGLVLSFISTIVYLAMSFWGLFEENQSFYYLITLASFCLWAIGCWFLLPKTLAGRSDSWRITRQVVCSSQALWILGVLLSWGVVEETVSPRFGQFLAGLADLIAFSGFVMCIILLHRAANDLYLRDIARWLMNVLWIIVPAGLLAWSITIPTPGGGGPLSAGVSALGIMIFILLLPKYLILIIIAWSLLQMLSYNIWSKRHIRLLANRPERILSKQASMAGAAKEHLQHIEDARGAVLADDACVVCGYNLQGHAAGSVCPECGSDSRGRSQAIHPTPHEDEAGDIPLE